MSEALAFRKCHVCDHVTEADQTVVRCTGCARHFAPFYYIDDQATPTYDITTRRTPMTGQWAPLRGLTAYWAARD